MIETYNVFTAEQEVVATQWRSEEPICYRCGARATKLWPISNFKNEKPFCQPCLDFAKQQLRVALGKASA